METCAESGKLAEIGIAANHDVRVTPATLSRLLGVGERGVKTDRRDARALSKASCQIELPSVYLRSRKARESSTRLGARSAMVTSRTQLVNTVRGWLRGEHIQVRGTTEHFADNVRNRLNALSQTLPDYIEHMLVCIEKLTDQIRAADATIDAIVRADSVCQLLMEIPGIGPITSLCFIAVVDDVQRFGNAHLLESYVGITPGERSSGNSVRRTGITKAGPAMLRHYLTQASITMRRLRPKDPITDWAMRISHRRGKHIATIAVARKLVGIMYAMWRDGTSYDPSRTAESDR